MTPEFVDRCVAAAADLALFFVGTSDEAMMQSLYDVRSNLQAQLAQTLGPDAAAVIAGAFVATVARRRREIEAAGTTARVVN